MEELNRTFIGIRLPGEVQQELGSTQLLIRQKAGSDVVRWNPSDTIHFVILPLGELLVATFAQVKRRIPETTSQIQPFRLTLEGLGGSPSALQPRFIWLAIGGDVQQLTLLHNTLEAALQPILRNYQPKPFVPHVDLGRIKIESEQNRTALGRAIRMSQIGCVAELQVDQIELFRSTATTMGPQLISEGSFTLGA